MPTTGDDGHPPVVMPAVRIRGILQGQKCLVTGANSGIGKAVAVAMGRAGADVVVNYAASKGGVMLMMKSIAQEVAPFRIRVNAIAPGAIRTPINTAAWETPEAYADLMRLIPYKRIGEPEDIAHAAVWLASDESDYVNGVTLFVDGGMTLYPEFASGG